MNRLRHSFKGYRRSMQMSENTLFVFVEGIADRYIYSRVANCECKGKSIEYQLVTSEELASDCGGKTVLLQFYDYLKQQHSLIDSFNDKITLSIFFLDKDIDDFLRIMRRSLHIVYTKYYELENYYFIHGDLSLAVAASASLDISTVQTGLGDYSQWRNKVTTAWKDWVKLCYFSHTRRIGSLCGYSHPESQINTSIYGSVDKNKFRRFLNGLQAKSGLNKKQFSKIFSRSCKKVDRIYSAGEYDRIFKGKWYTCFLKHDIKHIAGTRRYRSSNLEANLISNLAQSLNFNDSWAEYFRLPIRKLLVHIQQSNKIAP